MKKNNIAARIKSTANQVGVDSLRLVNILSSNVIYCSIENLEACKKVHQDILDYVKLDFPKQLSGVDGKIINLIPFYDYQHSESEIVNLGIDIVSPNVDDSVVDMRENLEHLASEISRLEKSLIRLFIIILKVMTASSKNAWKE